MMSINIKVFSIIAVIFLMDSVYSPLLSQVPIPLQDLSAFNAPGKSWQIAGDVSAELEKDNELNIEDGLGVLVNLPSKRSPGKDLFTDLEHGDMDLELEYMMAKGSNSGIYLQGRYEIQLLDSWGINELTPGMNGGIYPRWDDQRPKGQESYEGYSPRQNVGRAPGLWQKLKISFQAPRFDAQGNKEENAKILLIELNGVVIHENVELFGPTRGAVSNQESPQGPLRFQGDHGAVAFRNITLTAYGKPRPVLKDLEYTIYEGKYEKEPMYDSLPPEAEGTSVILSANLKQESQKFLLRYTGTLEIKEAGQYNFQLNASGGTGMIRINNKEVIPLGGWSNQNENSVELPAGDLPFELLYSKFVDWYPPALGLAISGLGVREYLISDVEEMQQSSAVDPILVAAEDTPVLRSFMDVPDGPRITHAVSVGSSEGVHYTYDLGHGTLVQMWRGGFLDATPMWHDRGDGSSRPQGSTQHFFNEPHHTIAPLFSEQELWKTDTLGSGYTSEGYILDANNQPTFRYRLFGASIEDAIRVIADGKGVQRTLNIKNAGENLYIRLAMGDTIETRKKGLFLIDGKAYYLRVEDAGGGKPFVRNVKDKQELIMPLGEKMTYSIIF